MTDEPTICLDLFPALLRLGGASVPDAHLVDGVGLSLLLPDGQRLGERTLFWAHGKQRAVPHGDRKLLVTPPGEEKGAVLPNLRDDPGE